MSGLLFVGSGLFDEVGLRLGPIALGGRFDLGVNSVDGTELPPFRFEFEKPAIIDATEGTDAFNDGKALMPVTGWASLRGAGVGTSYVRVVDAETGELFDRLPLSVVEVAAIRLVNAHAPEEPFEPGETQFLGVEATGIDGEEVRVFDLDMAISSGDITLGIDPSMWDCFEFDVPDGDANVVVTVGSMTVDTSLWIEAPETLP